MPMRKAGCTDAIQKTETIRPQAWKTIYWTMVFTDTFPSFVMPAFDGV
jgi:hypothetical protein